VDVLRAGGALGSGRRALASLRPACILHGLILSASGPHQSWRALHCATSCLCIRMRCCSRKLQQLCSSAYRAWQAVCSTLARALRACKTVRRYGWGDSWGVWIGGRRCQGIELIAAWRGQELQSSCNRAERAALGLGCRCWEPGVRLGTEFNPGPAPPVLSACSPSAVLATAPCMLQLSRCSQCPDSGSSSWMHDHPLSGSSEHAAGAVESCPPLPAAAHREMPPAPRTCVPQFEAGVGESFQSL
jgi:hypothetical protein